MAEFFSNKKLTPWTFTWLCEAFTFFTENIYVQFDGIVYQQIVRIPMDTNSDSLIADLFLYCYESDFMPNLEKYKRFNLIDKFTIPLEILTIYSPLITLNLLNIFPIYIQENFSKIKQIRYFGQKQDKSSDIEQQPPFGDNKYNTGQSKVKRRAGKSLIASYLP